MEVSPNISSSDSSRLMFRLEQDTSYTAQLEASLAPGLTKQFIIPNIVAGKMINMAYQLTSSALPSPVILSSLAVFTVSIIIILISIFVFLMSQTW